MDEKTKFQYRCAKIALIASIMFGAMSFYVSHDITENMLILIAQLLLFASSCFGLSSFIREIKNFKK